MIVEKLTHNSSDIRPWIQENSLYFDIETTGLQKKNALIYLIGCLHVKEDGTYQIHQWFAENPDQEEEILRAFLKYADSFQMLCHFNGDRFDLPFLKYRCELHGLSSPFSGKESRDLYRLYKPMQKFLGLSGFRQKDLEDFLAFPRQDPYTGKDCIQIYRDLIKYRDLSYADPLLLHNREDLLGLAAMEKLSGYDLAQKNVPVIENIQGQPGLLLAQCRLIHPLPRPISLCWDQWNLQGQEHTLEIRIDFHQSGLKNYYANYKDYYYLPAEDTAIHKSVGSYIDRHLRQKALPDNCYTRFLPDTDFLEDFSAMEEYLHRNLPLILALLIHSS